MGERPVSEEMHRQLRSLSEAYAEAADRRDVERFLAAFASDAVVEVYRPEGPGEPMGTFRGHDELARIPRSLASWASTAHLVGDAFYRWDGGDEASGEVACEAHHVRPTGDDADVRSALPGATDEVMTITYHDRYRCTDGGWRIVRREVRIASVQTEVVDAPTRAPTRGPTPGPIPAPSPGPTQETAS